MSTQNIKLLQEGPHPVQFKAVMWQALEYHEPTQKDVVEYVEFLGEKVKAYEKYKNVENDWCKISGWNRRSAEKDSKRNISDNTHRKADSDTKQKHRSPLCLHKKFAEKSVRHLLSECDETMREEAKTLILEFKRKKKEIAENINRVNTEKY